MFHRAWLAQPVLEAVLKVKRMAEGTGLTLAQFSLAWILRVPNVASAIIGATRPQQIDENAGASGKQVDPALFAEVERLLDPALANAG